MGTGGQTALQAWQSLGHPGGALGECPQREVRAPTLNQNGQAFVYTSDLPGTPDAAALGQGALSSWRLSTDHTCHSRGSPSFKGVLVAPIYVFLTFSILC